MPFFLSSVQNNFPDVELADDDGLLAFGSNLSVETLLKAYKKGIFPWYNEDEPISWYSPNPRFVLFPGKLNISNSMRTVLNNHSFKFSVDRDFAGVIKNCRLAKRKGEAGTWITDDIEEAYLSLFKNGIAHSAEAWVNGELKGGLYGVQLGKVFFGESMFSSESNASKFAFIKYVKFLQESGVELVDCQVYTAHLESLGAEFISRQDFTKLLGKLLG
ncbi:MAG: leucyl/phenylalanyl-tRNA--protein transferase [Ginsengibacter sp.]